MRPLVIKATQHNDNRKDYGKAWDTHRDIFSNSYYIKLKTDCIYNFPIDFKPSGCSFGFKSILKW